MMRKNDGPPSAPPKEGMYQYERPFGGGGEDYQVLRSK